jgi:NAD(P)-dependent dehydrogenase (short-subunit alcohol dehydrogenase family)
LFPIPNVSNDLSGRVALVTGAGGALGRRLAQVLSACGAAVAVADDSFAGAVVVAYRGAVELRLPLRSKEERRRRVQRVLQALELTEHAHTSADRSMAFADWPTIAERIGLAHSVVGSGGLSTGASAVTMLEGPWSNGE